MSTSSKRSYYEVLGCDRGASHEDIRRAYKREALKHHPDRNSGDPHAETRFKEINEAYQVLTDEQKKAIYDQFGHEGLASGMGGFGGGSGDVFSHMQDLFTEMFSGGGGRSRSQRRGQDLRVQARLSFREAAFGCKREISVRVPARCDDCSGSGAKKGTVAEACSQCRGSGQVSNARGFVMFTTTCTKCHGQGAVVRDPCAVCEGQGVVEKPKKVTVTFPAGIDSGQRLRMTGQGMHGSAGSSPGDLYVEVDVEEDLRFERDGADIVARVSVSFADLAMGAEIQVPALEMDEGASLPLVVPAGSQAGTVFTIKGQGIPRIDGRGRGSLVIVAQVDVPTTLSDRARSLLIDLDKELRMSAPKASKVASNP